MGHEHLCAAAAADDARLLHGLRQDAQGVVQRPLCGVAVKAKSGAVREGLTGGVVTREAEVVKPQWWFDGQGQGEG